MSGDHVSALTVPFRRLALYTHCCHCVTTVQPGASWCCQNTCHHHSGGGGGGGNPQHHGGGGGVHPRVENRFY